MRDAQAEDLGAIREIYNQGIVDRVATLDEDAKTEDDMRIWYANHGGRYCVLVAERDGRVVGWASLNPYSQRRAHASVADLSIYVDRAARGTGVGRTLLDALATRAQRSAFHKVVLFALASNEAGRRLYRAMGYREVGTFEEHGRLEGRYVDVIAMERIIPRASP